MTDMGKHRLVGHDVRLIRRRVTMRPGEDTGWHTHPGPLFVTVLRGTLTHYDRGCEPTVYTAGDTFIEARGGDAVHLGANHGVEPVVLDVLYVVPAGQPLRIPAQGDAESDIGGASSQPTQTVPRGSFLR